MSRLANSRSLTDFQRNAREVIEGINSSHEPMLITVNGKVQAVLVDPESFQKLELHAERRKFIDAVREGLKAADDGRARSAEEVYEEIRTKYDL